MSPTLFLSHISQPRTSDPVYRTTPSHMRGYCSALYPDGTLGVIGGLAKASRYLCLKSLSLFSHHIPPGQVTWAKDSTMERNLEMSDLGV